MPIKTVRQAGQIVDGATQKDTRFFTRRLDGAARAQVLHQTRHGLIPNGAIPIVGFNLGGL